MTDLRRTDRLEPGNAAAVVGSETGPLVPADARDRNKKGPDADRSLSRSCVMACFVECPTQAVRLGSINRGRDG